MESRIDIKQVYSYCLENFPVLMEEYGYGKQNFQEDNIFYSFDRFADFLRDEGFVKNDDDLITNVKAYILLLLAYGEDKIRNAVYVSFIEGLVDRSYKYPHLKGFIKDMPQEVKDFIKGFFIEEVLISLNLE